MFPHQTKTIDRSTNKRSLSPETSCGNIWQHALYPYNVLQAIGKYIFKNVMKPVISISLKRAADNEYHWQIFQSCAFSKTLPLLKVTLHASWCDQVIRSNHEGDRPDVIGGQWPDFVSC
jgi:hypothetical protein